MNLIDPLDLQMLNLRYELERQQKLLRSELEHQLERYMDRNPKTRSDADARTRSADQDPSSQKPKGRTPNPPSG